jgi:hypothetical protein
MAHRDIQAWLEKRVQNPKSSTLWKMNPFSYRRPGQRGRPCRVWVSDKYQDVRAAAEAVLGPLAVFEPVAEASAPPDVAVSVPEPELPPMPPVPSPVLGTLQITQADSYVQPPIKPAPVPPWQAMRAQRAQLPVMGVLCVMQADSIVQLPIAPPPPSEPLPPLPEPDIGSLEFWDEHPFFQASSDWLPVHIAREARSHD